MCYSLEVNNVSKSYFLKRTKTELLKELFLPFYREKSSNEKIVLNDVSFKVEKGESLGIIGMNGAGKSTLLKIITGTTFPTTGSISVSGRVVALLELGMGFHPEFTGRDNVMLAGQLIGLSPQEINSKMAEIEDFAEIGSFIDQPVKTYSSGMQMRLAFSLATSVRPDILIVDEALSVGDSYFQQKSFARIKQFKEEGTSLLFVSHDKSAVLTLCDRAMLLDKGKNILMDSPDVVMDYYNSLIAEKSNEKTIEIRKENGRVQTISGNKKIFFRTIKLLNMKNEEIEVVNVGEKVKLYAEIESTIDHNDLVFGFSIKERTGLDIYGINTNLLGNNIKIKKEEVKKIIVEIDANLGVGLYSISVSLHTGNTHLENNYQWIDLAATFSVVNTDKVEFVGVNYMTPGIKITCDGEEWVLWELSKT